MQMQHLNKIGQLKTKLSKLKSSVKNEKLPNFLHSHLTEEEIFREINSLLISLLFIL